MSASIVNDLRCNSAACRIHFCWWGIKKSLTNQQKTDAAQAFGADGDALSASKRLIDTKHHAWKALCSVRSRARAYWIGHTLPFPEPGIRLLRRQAVEMFAHGMEDFKEELSAAVRELELHYAELRWSAQERLGSLYNTADYPVSLEGEFGMTWDFPSVEPPDYLRQLNPELYAAEQEKAAARFQEAIALAEQAFVEEFGELVKHLAERLTDGPDGKKAFRASSIDNLRDFFERFRTLSVRSNPDLDALVNRAQDLVRGIGPDQLRNQSSTRAVVREQMQTIAQSLDAQIVTQSRRRIVMTPPAPVAPMQELAHV